MQFIIFFLFLFILSTLLLADEVVVDSNSNSFVNDRIRNSNSNSNSNVDNGRVNYGTSKENKDNSCSDSDKLCKQYLEASKEECFKNPRYMFIYCAKSCNTCGALTNISHFCSRENLSQLLNAPELVYPAVGHLQLNNVFDNIINDKSKYRRRGKLEILSNEPRIIAIDNFLTKFEMKKLLKLSERWNTSLASTTLINAEGQQVNVKYAKRNSQTGWCVSDECYNDPFVKRVHKRIEDLTNIPKDNFEHMQLVKYLEGQEYGAHNDYDGSNNVLSAPGPRILTLLMYMSEVEEGGDTSVPD
jgi:hypothetical protein